MHNVQLTSQLSYQDVIESLPRKRREVYNTIEILQPICNHEISNYLMRPINTITPRTNELVELGVVEKAYIKMSPTGKKAIYWKTKNRNMEPYQQELL